MTNQRDDTNPRAAPTAYSLQPLPAAVVAIVGPTASGKTALAIALAKKFNGEIIVADSRQVYLGMDIGTNKIIAEPSRRVRGIAQSLTVDGVPYHGIDLVEPNETLTLRDWKRYAMRTITEIWKRRKLPIIEGGTGLYVTALLENWDIPEVPPDKTIRAEVQRRIAQEGLDPIVAEILKADPDAAAFLDTKNPRRLVRAYEVIKKSGLPFSVQRRRGPKLFHDLRIGIDPGIATIDRRIRERARKQFAAGLENEVRRLAERFGWDTPAMSGIGYAEWRPRLDLPPEIEPPPVADILAENIRRNSRFARAQRKWFRRDPEIRWVHSTEEAERLVAQLLQHR